MFERLEDKVTIAQLVEGEEILILQGVNKHHSRFTIHARFSRVESTPTTTYIHYIDFLEFPIITRLEEEFIKYLNSMEHRKQESLTELRADTEIYRIHSQK